MAFQKKVMILSDISSNEGTGIIKFTEDGSVTTAEVSLHNTGEGKLTLLLKADNRLTAYPVSGKSTLNLNGISLPTTLDCLVINDKNKAVLYGSTSVDKYKCFNLLDEFNRIKPQKDNGKNLKNKDIKEEIQAYSHGENIVENGQPTLENIVEKGQENVKTDGISEKISVVDAGVEYDGDNFYLAVKPQLDEMFICYPVDSELANIVPNSRWVRVATEDDYYVVGVIFDLDEPKYICYGIHGGFAEKPPEEIKNLCDWLPLDLSNPDGEGYWMLYQSAKDGKTLKKE